MFAIGQGPIKHSLGPLEPVMGAALIFGCPEHEPHNALCDVTVNRSGGLSRPHGAWGLMTYARIVTDNVMGPSILSL